MARVWIVAMVVWYHALAMASAEDKNNASEEWKRRLKESCFELLEDYPYEEEPPNPEFAPWQGKRDSVQLVEELAPKRLPFKAWGGKRQDGQPKKKTKFHSWGGKRAPDPPLDYLAEAFKRTFHSWGGKRDADI